MAANTNIWAASITKGVFAAYMLDHGGIPLDVPVARQLAQPLDAVEPYKDTAVDSVRDPEWPRVTPRMLLAHLGAWRTSRHWSRTRKCIRTLSQGRSIDTRRKE